MKRVSLLHDYTETIHSWDWDEIVNECRSNLEPSLEDSNELEGRCCLGSVFSIMPSGKYYMPWCSNQTCFDTIKDSYFYELLEEWASSFGLFITSGEGDPCDLFAGLVEEVTD